MRIFLDANIVFSAAQADGAVRKLLQLLHNAGHLICVDGFVMEEARRNLLTKAPGAESALLALTVDWEYLPTKTFDPTRLQSLPITEKDQPVLAAPIAGQCQGLLTGDRTHFGHLFGRTIGGVTIYSPAQLAEAVL